VVSEARTPFIVDFIILELNKMASNNNVHIGKLSHFDGNNYDYWKIRMSMHLKAMGGKVWPIVRDGFIVLKEHEPSLNDHENVLTNDQAMNVFYDALDINEFNRIKNIKTAHEIWTKLMEIHEGTTIVKSEKLYVCKGKFEQFLMKEDESVSDMFYRLNEIVNELKGLGFNVSDVVFTRKFLRFLPEKYDTIVTMLVRSDLTTTSPTEVFGEILTQDIFKKSQAEAMSLAKKVKGESIALKAKVSKAIEKEESEDEGNGSESDEELALFVKKFNKFMRKKKGQPRRGQTNRRNAFNDRKCFECGEPGHIAISCPSKKNKGKDGDDKKKKKFFHKKRDGKAYLVEWDLDASSDNDDDDSSSKLNVRIAIKEAPSLFSSPLCLMAKGDAKVNYKVGENYWVLDSGCTQHMTSDMRMFTAMSEEGCSTYDSITFGDNRKGNVKGLCKIAISNDHSKLLVESLNFNLLSVAQLCDFGFSCSFTVDDVLISSVDGSNLIFKGFRHENIYLIDFSSNETKLTTCLFSKASLG
jgi:hypothetical protein